MQPLARRHPRRSQPRHARAALLEALEPRKLFHAGHDHGTPPPPPPPPVDDVPPPPVTTPHANNPTLRDEHMAMLDLVPTDLATHTAISRGLWSDPATWLGGLVPTADARVWIPGGTGVTVDAVYRDSLEWLRADGLLSFATDRDTGLKVETVVVAPGGRFEMGTAESPVLAEFEAKLIFADRGELAATDARKLGRGLISHGSVSIHGAATTPYLALEGLGARSRSTSLTLVEEPAGWKVGDRVVLTGTDMWRRDDDFEGRIVAIDGRTVTLDKPLEHHHLVHDDRFRVYLANVSRNAVLESENAQDVSRRGHVMFMHSNDVQVAFTGFYGLGRTDKRTPIDDVEFIEDGTVEPRTGANPRGRYAVHFHRTGIGPDSRPSVIRGSAVVDSPGWGVVNHSSNVQVEDNVSFDIVGAHFVTEAGDEVGSFRRNLAIKSEGSGDGAQSRKDVQDFGHEGSGFWFQGPNTEVEGNIAVNHRRAGFFYFTVPLDEAGLGKARLPAATLVNPDWALGKDHADVGNVPIRLFLNNESFGNDVGFESMFHLLDAKHDGRSVVEGFITWGNRSRAFHTPYTRNMTFLNVTAYRLPMSPGDTAFSGNEVTESIRYINATVEGWNVGINMPSNGHNVVEGGVFNNVINIQIHTAKDPKRVIDINGDIAFSNPPPEVLKDKTPWNIFLRTNWNPKDNDLTTFFNPDRVRLGTVTLSGKQIYYKEQDADFIPFPKNEFKVQGAKTKPPKLKYDKDGNPIAHEAAPYVPREMHNKTNAQLFSQYGLAIGGIVAPKDAMDVPGISGVVGDPGTYLPKLTLSSDKYTNQVKAYTLQYRTSDGTRVKEATPSKLRQGWNLLTRDIGGQKRTLLVYGDTINPTFQLDPQQPLVLNPADLRRPLSLQGEIHDDSFGKRHFSTKFSGLDKYEQFTAADGSKFIVLTFKVRDLAKNDILVSVNVRIDPNAPLIRELTAKKLPPRVLSGTITALLGFKEDRG